MPGGLRVYLGAAPGVGKTVAMLDEGRRRRSRGTDVVVGLVEDHGRTYTRAEIADLPVLPRAEHIHRGLRLGELDVAGVLARRPQVVLVDELAHTNAPGSERPKRWQDVQVLLGAGIDVITTLNVQHLESLNDVVASITGITQQETVPDAVVRAADGIELVDMSPSALRRRLAHGHVYSADRVDAALGNFFREGNLTALRELALLWVADRVEEGLERYRTRHGISATWAARERIVVALPSGPEGATLLRRGARIAAGGGRSLVAVHVLRADGTAPARPADLEQQRLLVEKLGGTLHLVVGDDIPAAVLSFARSVNGTQIVVGASTHARWTSLLRPSSVMAIVRDSGDIDVHVVTHPAQNAPRFGTRAAHWWGALRSVQPAVRTGLQWLVAAAVPWALTAILLTMRTHTNLSTQVLVFMLGVLGTALICEVAPASFSAVLAAVLANYFFTPPFGSFTIATPENALALIVFVLVAIAVASIVARSARRAREAAAGRAEAQLVAAAVSGALTEVDPVSGILERARIGFGMTGAALFDVADPAGPARLMSSVGAGGCSLANAPADQPLNPDSADAVATVESGEILALYGHPLPADQTRLVDVFARQAALAAQRRRLEARAAEVDRLEQSDQVRTAILSALSHDLRTPLATIKTAVSGLDDATATMTPADHHELLGMAEHAADQLDALLGNLLDLSRLQTGVLRPVRRPVSVDEVVHRALISVLDRLGEQTAAGKGTVIDNVPDDLPLVDSDAGLLERVLANVIGNALRYSNAGAIRLIAGYLPNSGGCVEIRVVDRGPGVAVGDRDRMFAPFQRLGDVPGGSGLGLGLAVARGLADALDVALDAEDTPGGGLTMVIRVPVAMIAPIGAGT